MAEEGEIDWPALRIICINNEQSFDIEYAS
jgi:hypothetical protein